MSKTEHNPTDDEKNKKDEITKPDQDNHHETDQDPEEIGGPEGPEPTRYGDWEVDGRCTDF